MRRILEQRNRALLGQVRALAQLLSAARVPQELQSYRDRILGICHEREADIGLNQTYLSLGLDEILPDVLSRTKLVTSYVRLLSSRLVTPVSRASDSDRLCLATLAWLHHSHVETTDYPPAFLEGTVGTWPYLTVGAPIYVFPCIEQRGLLYQALFFHEFGHILYACHKSELDALVGELQRAVNDSLLPASQRNDQHAAAQAAWRRVIVDTWYNWAQELFCDAVGFTIGGPCFVRAFSEYLSNLDEADFYRQPDELRSSHPVTWLRVRFLAGRATLAGFPELARAAEEEWHTVAQALRVVEDYHGFYADTLEDAVTRIIDDMLTETGPRTFLAAEAAGGDWSPQADTLVRLFNWAWQIYAADPERYPAWEAAQIALLLGS
jgi:hypothetical protein